VIAMPTPKSLAVSPLLLLLGCAAAGGAGGVPRAGARVPSFTDPVSGMELVLVKGGCYPMGAADDDCDATPEERPVHEVCVGDLYVGRYEVTRAQWRRVLGTEAPAASTCKDDDCPVDNVTFADVQGFIARLDAKSDCTTYRLPTEAEWEYAARSGGRDERYAGGKDLSSVSWFADNSGKVNHPVGKKAPNGLGLYDMSGNVWEMASDFYSATYYRESPRVDPRGPAAGDDHTVRGGCRTGGAANQRTTRRTFIGDRTKGLGLGGNVGFRLVSPVP
jgi:formylglycine-generating enzyme required for sulfatase activity